MLSQFHVRNYALLDEVTVAFSPGLNILTGETGAGKSILMGALSLILGDRAATDMIRTGADTATVEGLFERFPSERPVRLPDDLGIVFEDGSLIIRREVTRDGRSRCAVNGNMVTVSSLKRLGEVLVDLHGQHDHQSLLNPRIHIECLDGFGRLEAHRERVANAYRRHTELTEALRQLDEQTLAIQERRELYRYQLEELNAARITIGEDDALERELAILTHAEQLIQATGAACEALSQQEGSLLEVLGHVTRRLEENERIDPGLREAVENCRSARYHLEDANAFLQAYRDRIEFDPARLAEVQDRLDLLNTFKRKYGGTLEEVCAYRDRIAKEIDRIGSADKRRAELEREREAVRETLTHQAQRLSEARRRAASKLESRVVEELAELGMEKTRFQVRIAWEEDPDGMVEIEGARYRVGPHGLDRVEFMLSPNPGEALKPLAHIVSGGEISRIMLALKAILAESDQISTLVFDEIDLGIGGRIAESVGQKLKQLAQSYQILCITHLHQVACWGDTHFTVSKRSSGKRTVTRITPLDEDGRVQEIARMLAGETVDEMALIHAREILRRASGVCEESALAKK